MQEHFAALLDLCECKPPVIEHEVCKIMPMHGTRLPFVVVS
jgi:hypothetical protein